LSTGHRPSREPRRRSAANDRPDAANDRPDELVRLVTRLVLAQAGIGAAIGIAYSRRHIPSIIITLMLVAALYGLALLTRSGTHAAWIAAVAFESVFIAYGLVRFITSRYLGGTLLALITWGVLLHPAVSRAFAAGSWRAEQGYADPVLSEASQPSGAATGGLFHDPGRSVMRAHLRSTRIMKA
jgi:hypothetical protein